MGERALCLGISGALRKTDVPPPGTNGQWDCAPPHWSPEARTVSAAIRCRRSKDEPFHPYRMSERALCLEISGALCKADVPPPGTNGRPDCVPLLLRENSRSESHTKGLSGLCPRSQFEGQPAFQHGQEILYSSCLVVHVMQTGSRNRCPLARFGVTARGFCTFHLYASHSSGKHPEIRERFSLPQASFTADKP